MLDTRPFLLATAFDFRLSTRGFFRR